MQHMQQMYYLINHTNIYNVGLGESDEKEGFLEYALPIGCFICFVI